MNKLINQLLFVLTLGGFCACTNNKTVNEGTQDTTQTETALTPALSDDCYAYVSGKDSVRLHMKTNGNTVSGELIYSFFEKDNNTGTIQGQMKGDTIFADYTFMSEGRESVREIALLKKGDNLTEGYGEVKEAGNKMVFTNTGGLNFNNSIVLKKTGCKQDEHGCLLLMGYVWSSLRNSCIQPSTTGIRLHAKGEAGSAAPSAFLLMSADKSQAEVFLPGKQEALLMERKGTEGNYFWENKDLKLYPWKGYVLKRGNAIMYAGK